MAGTRARSTAGGASEAGNGSALTRQETAEYIASGRQVARGGQMPFLAYLINVALEEANNEKTARD